MKITGLRSLAVLIWFLSALVNADDAENRAAMLGEIESLAHTGRISLESVSIAGRDLLIDIYDGRGYELMWSDLDQVAELISAIRATEADGLDPADYHLALVLSAYEQLNAGENNTARQLAAFDLLFTDSLARLGYHQRFGKVNPYTLDSFWNFDRNLNDIDPVQAIQEAVAADSLQEYLNTVFARGWFYRQLRSALTQYRDIEKNGGWPQIADGPTLRHGSGDERVAIMIRRLAVTGDMKIVNSNVFDDVVEAGVRRFQDRHGLEADGIAGRATLRAMNVTAGQRVRQLEVNLERARWILDDIVDDFVLVNIAGFRAYVWKNREIVWETSVQVGRTYRQSPVFKDTIKYLVFNPTWTVPYSIASKDKLPQIQSDPEFFTTHDFDVKDRSGALVDPGTIDWSQITRRNLRYTLVQRPGPNNALGRVKFMFPNEYAIYLHDTPSKYLFTRAERTFSSGCIRVQNPFDLAEVLLGSDGWTQDKFQDVLDSGKTRTVFLSTPMPVLLLYWTAEVDDDNIVYFYNDVYSRDQRIADALDEPFTLDLPGIAQ